MALHLLIDGYNLIRRYAPLARAEAEDLAQGREALLRWLAEYRKTAPHAITVVFDGHKGGAPSEERDLYRGIRIWYSRFGQTADEVIKDLTARERGKFLVITSDRELAQACRSYGNEVIGADTFARRVEEKLFGRIKGEDDERDELVRQRNKKKGAAFRLSKKAKKERRLEEKL